MGGMFHCVSIWDRGDVLLLELFWRRTEAEHWRAEQDFIICWPFREHSMQQRSLCMCSVKHNPSSCSQLLPVLQLNTSSHQEGYRTTMFLYLLVFMAYHSSRWIPRSQRLKFQIVNAVFTALVLVPQFYVMGRPKSSRYCRQPLLNNLSASIALSFVAAGFSVIFTFVDPVPQSLWASYHVFGLLTCGQGLCTAILTLTAAACAKTTPELYYMSLTLTVASIFSTGFFMVRGGLWLKRRPVTDPGRNNE